MPRELIHWGVIERVFNRVLAERPRLDGIVVPHLAAGKVGAVAHDAPYFLRGGKQCFEYAAKTLHGYAGEDTLQPLRNFVSLIRSQIAPSEQAPYWAFLIGMISHVVTDSHFHPFVYYCTGDYYHPDKEERSAARARHRLFEVQLDAWFLESYSERKAYLSASLRELPDSLKETLFAFLGSSVPPPAGAAAGRDSPDKQWKKAFAKYSWSQRLFHSASAGAAVRTLAAVGGSRLRELDALFSYGRNGLPMLRERKLSYRNPVTGVWQHKGLTALVDKSVEDSLTLVRALEPFILGQAHNTSVPWSAITGPSLSFGLAGSRAEDARFFLPRNESKRMSV